MIIGALVIRVRIKNQNNSDFREQTPQFEVLLHCSQIQNNSKKSTLNFSKFYQNKHSLLWKKPKIQTINIHFTFISITN